MLGILRPRANIPRMAGGRCMSTPACVPREDHENSPQMRGACPQAPCGEDPYQESRSRFLSLPDRSQGTGPGG